MDVCFSKLLALANSVRLFVMKILVIGGTKFIGPYVVRALVDMGHDVTVFHRGESEPALPDAVRHIHSPTAAIPVQTFPDEILAASPDVVIHMIPMGERDAQAALRTFRGKRILWISSGDIYRAYGVLTGLEPGPPQPMPLHEDSELRTVLFPYRKNAKSADSLEFWYEKILMERIAMSDPATPGTILRLPKVYGPGNNDDFATVYAFRHQPNWRWTHGYVENVAAAIVLAATNAVATGKIYNVGEEVTPTMAERLGALPPSEIAPNEASGFNFAQDIVYDTSRIRTELGFRELVAYEEGIRRTLAARSDPKTAHH